MAVFGTLWNSLNTHLRITAQTQGPTCSTGELCPVLISACREEAAAESRNRFQAAISLRCKGHWKIFISVFCPGIGGYYWDVFNVHTGQVNGMRCRM